MYIKLSLVSGIDAGNKSNDYRLRSHPKCLQLFDLFKPNIKNKIKLMLL
jgi:hypothetical protein